MEASYRIRAIYSFVRAADAGSFAAAARLLGISSAAVSKNVALLEHDLGVRLFNRTTRSLTLTEEGALFAQRAKIALDALDSAVDTAAEERSGPRGKVRISASHALGQKMLLPLLPGLMNTYPDLRVEADFDDHVVDLVRDGYDLALRGGIMHDSSLISRPVCDLNTLLVASGDYLARFGIPTTVNELRQHRLVARRFLNGNMNLWHFHNQDGSLEAIDPSNLAILTLSSPESVVDAILAGAGIGEAPVHLVWKHLQENRLKIVLYPHHYRGNYQLTLQYPHRALVPPRIKATVTYLLDEFSRNEALHVPLDALKQFSV